MPIVIEMAGSSTWIAGSGRTSSGSAMRLADRDVLEAGDGDDVAGAGALGGVALERAGLQQLGDARVASASRRARTQATVWPFFSVPLKTRSSARRPRNGLESRFVTQACSGASSS